VQEWRSDPSHGISRETFYRWQRKYGGIQVSETKRLRALVHHSDRGSIRKTERLAAAGTRPPSAVAMP
jgi:hypothetical protein